MSELGFIEVVLLKHLKDEKGSLEVLHVRLAEHRKDVVDTESKILVSQGHIQELEIALARVRNQSGSDR